MAVVYSENLLCMRLDLVTVCDSCTVDDGIAPLAIYRLLSGSLKATVNEHPEDTAGRGQGCKSPQAQAFGVIFAQRRSILDGDLQSYDVTRRQTHGIDRLDISTLHTHKGEYIVALSHCMYHFPYML